MSQEIQLYNRIQDPISASVQLGKPFAVMFGLNSDAHGTCLALACMAENKTPFDIVRTYDFVLGRLRKKALAMFAEFRAKGGKVEWIETGRDGKKAEAKFTFEGQTITERFTIEEAQLQQLVKKDSNWIKTPANMLRARLLSNVIAMLCPEIVAGVSGNPEDESDDSGTEQKPLLPTTKTEIEIKPANVTDVKTVTPETPAATESTPANTAPSKPVVHNWADAKDSTKLSNEAVLALMELIPGECQAKAFAWFEEKKWIPPMGGIKELSPARGKKIYEAPEKFLKHIGAIA